VSPYLEQALEMRDEERPGLLASLQVTDPQLASDLMSLLDEHEALNREGFLWGEVPWPLQAAPRGQTEHAVVFCGVPG
jgi:hypothetical protein